MFKPIKILDEKDKRLRSISEDVVFYIDRKAKKLGQQLRGRGYEVIEEEYD